MKGIVYLICDSANNTYKIGVTRNKTNKRLQKLQTGNSTELFIVTTYETEWPFRLETMLHTKFRAKQELNEWFNLDTEDVTNFKDICEKEEHIIKALLDNPFFSKNLK